MKINPDELKRQVGVARTRGWTPILKQAERRHKLPAGLLIAIASRETDMNDIVGDNGHGRGLFQIDDRAHGDWLSQHGAKGAGTKPSVADAAAFAAALLESNRSFGQKNGIAPKDLLKFACSAYNAGAGGALSGVQSGDSDARTTGRRLRARRAGAPRCDPGRQRRYLAAERRRHPPQGRSWRKGDAAQA